MRAGKLSGSKGINRKQKKISGYFGETRCKLCKRILMSPESIKVGFGRVCLRKMKAQRKLLEYHP